MCTACDLPGDDDRSFDEPDDYIRCEVCRGLATQDICGRPCCDEDDCMAAIEEDIDAFFDGVEPTVAKVQRPGPNWRMFMDGGDAEVVVDDVPVPPGRGMENVPF